MHSESIAGELIDRAFLEDHEYQGDVGTIGSSEAHEDCIDHCIAQCAFI